MSVFEEDLTELVVEILEEEDAVAVTTGIFAQHLENCYGVEKERDELAEFLDESVDEGVLKYNHGEVREYDLPG